MSFSRMLSGKNAALLCLSSGRRLRRRRRQRKARARASRAKRIGTATAAPRAELEMPEWWAALVRGCRELVSEAAEIVVWRVVDCEEEVML